MYIKVFEIKEFELKTIINNLSERLESNDLKLIANIDKTPLFIQTKKDLETVFFKNNPLISLNWLNEKEKAIRDNKKNFIWVSIPFGLLSAMIYSAIIYGILAAIPFTKEYVWLVLIITLFLLVKGCVIVFKFSKRKLEEKLSHKEYAEKSEKLKHIRKEIELATEKHIESKKTDCDQWCHEMAHKEIILNGYKSIASVLSCHDASSHISQISKTYLMQLRNLKNNKLYNELFREEERILAEANQLKSSCHSIIKEVARYNEVIENFDPSLNLQPICSNLALIEAGTFYQAYDDVVKLLSFIKSDLASDVSYQMIKQQLLLNNQIRMQHEEMKAQYERNILEMQELNSQLAEQLQSQNQANELLQKNIQRQDQIHESNQQQIEDLHEEVEKISQYYQNKRYY